MAEVTHLFCTLAEDNQQRVDLVISFGPTGSALQQHMNSARPNQQATQRDLVYEKKRQQWMVTPAR